MVTLSPHNLLKLILTLSFILVALFTLLSLNIPVVKQRFSVEQGHVTITNPVTGVTKKVVSISSAEGELTPVSAQLLTEEPDTLETYADYNHFMEAQGTLARIFSAAYVQVGYADGSADVFKVQQRGLSDLPFSFYLQMLSGLLCIAIASSLWAFNRRHLSNRIYCFMGFMVAFACFSSAVYTTRELAMDAPWFRVLSVINHFGSLGFGGGLAAIFMAYPQRLLPADVIAAVVFSFVIFFLIDTFQLPEKTSTGFHIWPLFYIVLAFSAAAVQWFKTRYIARDRAILKWLLLSIMATSMIFTFMNIIPSAFAMETIGPQALTISGFALGFILMALGLSRYKLFNLDRWWYQYWMWLLAGGLVILLDIVLITSLGLDSLPALSLSLAVIGWAYLPLRQWMWGRIRPIARHSLHKLLPEIVHQLFSAKNKSDIHQAWRNILDNTFSPLEIKSIEPVRQVKMEGEGQILKVPSIEGLSGFSIHFPYKGRHLFSQQDVKLAQIIYELVHSAYKGLCAREEGINAERNRIKRDLHDDLGARLLSLSHAVTPGITQEHARKAIAELRYILSALEQDACEIEQALDIWQSECRERALNQEIDLVWTQALNGSGELPSRLRHNIGRVFRELTSNALKHSHCSEITVNIKLANGILGISFSDNGMGTGAAETAGGRGKSIIISRLEEVGGRIDWENQKDKPGVHVYIEIPLPHF